MKFALWDHFDRAPASWVWEWRIRLARVKPMITDKLSALKDVKIVFSPKENADQPEFDERASLTMNRARATLLKALSGLNFISMDRLIDCRCKKSFISCRHLVSIFGSIFKEFVWTIL
jgi:hypothetical protein